MRLTLVTEPEKDVVGLQDQKDHLHVDSSDEDGSVSDYIKAAKLKGEPAFAGDIWTFTALDRTSKMIVSWVAAERSYDSALRLMEDASDRISGDLQISTDGFPGYERAVEAAFAKRASYGQVIKKYGAAPDKGPERKYSPGVCIAAEAIINRERKLGHIQRITRGRYRVVPVRNSN